MVRDIGEAGEEPVDVKKRPGAKTRKPAGGKAPAADAEKPAKGKPPKADDDNTLAPAPAGKSKS